jgi:hypothetical protein
MENAVKREQVVSSGWWQEPKTGFCDDCDEPLNFGILLVIQNGFHSRNGITVDMLHQVWDEFDYCVDVCRVILGAHIEGL